MADYANFRQRLEGVLRTRDVKQVQAFLIAEKQWSASQPADPEFAMWMIIAGNPNLRELHEQARGWLMSHGREDEAHTLLGKGDRNVKDKKPHSRGQQSHAKKPGKRQ
jgi:hypothetical protein